MQYFDPMWRRKRMSDYIRGANPYQAPMQPTTMESQVSAALRAPVDASAIPGAPQAPSMPPEVPTLEDLYSGANKDFSMQEGQLQQQREFANALRATPMPEGQTVGPSNIYTRNPWDAAEVAFNRAYGGYLEGKNRREAAALAEEKGAAADMAARAQAGETRQKWQQDETQNALQQDQNDISRMNAQTNQRNAEISAAKLAQDARQFQKKQDLDTLALNVELSEPTIWVDEEGKSHTVNQRIDTFGTGVVWQDMYTKDAVDPQRAGWTLIGNAKDVAKAKSASEASDKGLAPKRFFDPETGMDYYLTWLGNSRQYEDAFTHEKVDPEIGSRLMQQDSMTEGQLQKAWENYLKTNGDSFTLMNDIMNAEDVWRENGWTGEEPLFNWFTKQSGAMGDAFRLIADADAGQPLNQENYAAAQTVYNAITRMRAGLSQTASEVERVAREIGQDPLVSPEVMMMHWDKMRGVVENTIDRANSTLSPAMVRTFKAWRRIKGGDMTGDMSRRSEAANAAEAAPAAGGGGQMSRTSRLRSKPAQEESIDDIIRRNRGG